MTGSLFATRQMASLPVAVAWSLIAGGIFGLLSTIFPSTFLLVHNGSDRVHRLRLCAQGRCRTVELAPSELRSLAEPSLTDGSIDVEGMKGCEYYLPSKHVSVCLLRLETKCRRALFRLPRVIVLMLAVLSIARGTSTLVNRRRIASRADRREARPHSGDGSQ